MTTNYLGTVNIPHRITAHFEDSHYELHIVDKKIILIYDEVLGALSRLPELIANGGQLDIHGHSFEPKPIWNTMLSYLRKMGRDTTNYEAIMSQFKDRDWLRNTGSCPEKMIPIEEDTL